MHAHVRTHTHTYTKQTNKQINKCKKLLQFKNKNKKTERKDPKWVWCTFEIGCGLEGEVPWANTNVAGLEREVVMASRWQDHWPGDAPCGPYQGGSPFRCRLRVVMVMLRGLPVSGDFWSLLHPPAPSQSWSVTEPSTSTPAGLTPLPTPLPTFPAPGTYLGTTKVTVEGLGG